MIALLLVFIVSFTFLSFFPVHFPDTGFSIFSGYFFSIFDFISNNFGIFLFFLFILVVITYRLLKTGKKYSFSQKIIMSFIRIAVAGSLGSLITLVVLFIIALLQLNVQAILTNTSPQILGIQSNKDTISKTLQSFRNPPEIIAADTDQHKQLLAIAEATTGRDSYYGKFMLPSIPNSLTLPIKQQSSSILLIGDVLIINEINASDLQAISPLLGYLFVKNYFHSRPIKTFPKVEIIGRQEYQKYRETDAQKKLLRIDNQLVTIDKKISSLSANIAEIKGDIEEKQVKLKGVAASGNNQYKKCIAGGNSQDKCREDISDFSNTVDKGNKEIHDLGQDILRSQLLIKEYEYYKEFYKTQQTNLKSQQNNLPHELGVFEPASSIKIALDTTSSHALADYFETLTHEYLHYASFVSPEKQLPDSFFEEGLTEYFARKTIQNELHTSTNLGYPVQVKIIDQMTKLILERELADIYFTKNQVALETTLNRVYGDNFYQENQVLFESLQYTSDPKQVLKIANTIMQKIDGPELTEKDLMSTYSNL